MRNAIVTAVVAVLGIAFTLQQPRQPQQGPDLAARVAELEKRVTVLEKATEAPAGVPAAAKPAQVGEFLVPVTLTNKQYRDADPVNRGTWEDVVIWDARYDFSKLPKPARAIKGILEFSDLFGESKFMLKATINQPVARGGEHTSKGTGFRYNQFLAPEQWVRATEVKDMRVVFRVQQIIYADGEQAEFK
jgi:hypothetical protein